MHKLWLHSRTIYHFFDDGILTGGLVGGLTGTLLFPGVGSIAGAFTGSIVGLTLGIITGLVVIVLNHWLLTPDTEMTTYRRTLTRTLGYLAFGLLGGGSTVGILSIGHNDSVYGHRDATYLLVYTLIWLPVFLAFVIPATLCIATSAGYYADRYTSRFIVRKNEDILAAHLRRHPGATRKFAFIMFSHARWIMLASATIFGLGYFASMSQPAYPMTASLNPLIGSIFGMITAVFLGALFGLVVVSGVTLIVLLLNVVTLRIVNRLYFDEYGTHLTLAQYKKRLMLILGLTTLIYSLVVTAVVFAPVAALIAVLSAREYAEWHYASEEKLKRDFAARSGQEFAGESLQSLKIKNPAPVSEHEPPPSLAYMWTTKRDEYTLIPVRSRPDAYVITHFVNSPQQGITVSHRIIEDNDVYRAVVQKMLAEGMVNHIPELRKFNEERYGERFNRP